MIFSRVKSLAKTMSFAKEWKAHHHAGERNKEKEQGKKCYTPKKKSQNASRSARDKL